MRIYIASSWKNQHAVELLTLELRRRGHDVISFVEKAVTDEGRGKKLADFDDWVASPAGEEKFVYDVRGATTSDLVIYVGPSGTDAWAEVGAAFQAKVPVWGLIAKGEQAGLMRRMVLWFPSVHELLAALDAIDKQP